MYVLLISYRHVFICMYILREPHLAAGISAVITCNAAATQTVYVLSWLIILAL